MSFEELPVGEIFFRAIVRLWNSPSENFSSRNCPSGNVFGELLVGEKSVGEMSVRNCPSPHESLTTI